jgi:hypothetical protein
LAEALSRVLVTREESEHLESYSWATQEGRGDRMPRFLERAIQEVPHAAARNVRNASSARRYEGATRPFARATFLMSVVAIGTGIAVSVASPSTVAPLLDGAQRWIRTASMNMTFTSTANAATPRLAFGEALRNYSEQAAAQEARANIVVSNLAPGTTLSAGTPVSDTAWSLPQSQLDHLVITFPTGAPADAMRATVEIPGNSAASTGKFSVELRQAGEENAAAEPAATVQPDAAATATVEPAAEEAPAAEVAPEKARTETPKVAKRKLRPSAAIVTKSPSNQVAAAKPSSTSLAAKAAIVHAASNAVDAKEAASPLLGLFPSLSAASSPNALTMFSLGGPALE